MSNATWQGKDVNKMTKDELIKALLDMGALYEQSLKEHSHDLDFLYEKRKVPWWKKV